MLYTSMDFVAKVFFIFSDNEKLACVDLTLRDRLKEIIVSNMLVCCR